MSANNAIEQAGAQRDDVVGRVIDGRYRLARRIGAGGMASVFEAEHLALGARVAVKLLHHELARNDAALHRFLDEARTAATLRHPNIVRVVDVGTDPRAPYMVLDYLHGETLAELLGREPVLALDRVVALFDPVLDALAYAHRRGVVHRDVKPENIFLARGGDDEPPVPVVLDFGLAKRDAANGVRVTGVKSILGTPAYMAPEQITGSRDVTAAADQYASAVVIYEALAGRLPHEVPDGGDLLMARLTRPPADLADARPELDRTVAAVVMRGLAREPTERFGSLDAFRHALLGAAEQAGCSAATSRLAATTWTDATLEERHGAPRTPGHSSGDAAGDARGVRPRWRRYAVPLVVAAVAAFGGWRVGAASREAGPGTDRPRVVFHVRAEPPTTAILLDGALVGYGSADLERVRNARHYHLALRAPGREPVDVALSAIASATIVRTLAPTPPPIVDAGNGAPAR